MGSNISGLIEELQPFARDLVAVCGAAGLQPRITSTLRSGTEQARLYRRYQQGLQKYPVAPPGTSAHEFGFAFDMVVADLNALPDVGAYWKSQGGIWGGEFNDPIHFEYPGFKQYAQQQPQKTFLESTADSVFGFIDNLPWYVSMLLPTSLLTHKIDPETAIKVLHDAGIDY